MRPVRDCVELENELTRTFFLFYFLFILDVHCLALCVRRYMNSYYEYMELICIIVYVEVLENVQINLLFFLIHHWNTLRPANKQIDFYLTYSTDFKKRKTNLWIKRMRIQSKNQIVRTFSKISFVPKKSPNSYKSSKERSVSTSTPFFCLNYFKIYFDKFFLKSKKYWPTYPTKEVLSANRTGTVLYQKTTIFLL